MLAIALWLEILSPDICNCGSSEFGPGPTTGLCRSCGSMRLVNMEKLESARTIISRSTDFPVVSMVVPFTVDPMSQVRVVAELVKALRKLGLTEELRSAN